MTRMHVVALGVVLVLAVPGCVCADKGPGGGGGTGGGSGGGGGGSFRVSGQLMRGTSPGPDAKVEVKKAGVVLASADAHSGVFSVNVPLAGPETLLVSIRADGIAPIHRVVRGDQGGEYQLEEQVVSLPVLACAGTTCRSGGLVIDGLPAGTTGAGRAFNPVTERDAFPGGFDDTEGNMLISGAFATIELRDSSGRAVSTLGQPATLKIPIPKDTWGDVVDVTPGDAKITVPLFTFDEALASWRREGQADLVVADGTLIANTQLAAIRAKTFPEGVFAAGQVSHFSTWNVDWPISSHGCITGLIAGADGGPQASARVEVSGVTFNGRARDFVTGPDGRFCSEVLRSEAPGEDVNNDGVTGQRQRVQLVVAQGREVYDGREHEVPAVQGTCPTGSSLDVGTITLDEASRFPPRLCDFSGRVVDRAGAAVDGVNVTVTGTGSSDDAQLLCPALLDCLSFAGQSQDGGLFAGRVVVREKLTVSAIQTDKPDPDTDRVAHGTRDYRACPAGPVELALSTVLLSRSLTVTVSGNSISWAPAVPVQLISVETATGTTRWLVTGTNITSPVTYGQAPAGTFQSIGPLGALGSGDEVGVSGSSQENGDFVSVTGVVTVP